MSASQEKKNRSALRGEGADKKKNAADEASKQSRKFRRNTIIAVVVIVIVVAAAIVINSNLFYRKLTAVTIGNTKYSAAEVDVFYRSTFQNVYNSYGDFASYLIDTSKPLTEQQYTENQTWADYIFEETLDSMKQITALNDDAAANGYTLSDEDRAEIDSSVQAVSSYAQMYGVSTDQYLASVYGTGVTEKIYTSVLTKMYTAQSYARQKSDSLTFSQAELNDYYSENADDLDFYSYYYYLVSSGDAAFLDEADDAAKAAAAHDAAVEIAAAGNADEFAANVEAFSGAAPTEQYLQGSSLPSDYSAWLKDASRAEGDTEVFDAEGSGTYAVLFVARDENDYYLKNMRHILIETEANENSEYTDEARDAARTRIEEIQAEWQQDPTEEHFAELANAYSDDSGNTNSDGTLNGGLYENVGRKQMVTSINDFLFNENHMPGDTALLYGESGYYQGWHMVYYVGEGELYRTYLAENALRSLRYDEFIDGLTSGYIIYRGSGVRYVTL